MKIKIIILAILVAFLVLMFITTPDKDQHIKAINNTLLSDIEKGTNRTSSEGLKKMTFSLTKLRIETNAKFYNFYLFSGIKEEENWISVGFLGMVFVSGE